MRALNAALDAVEDAGYTAAALAEEVESWQNEWAAQRRAESLTLDAHAQRILAQGAQTTAAAIRAAVSDAGRFCEELEAAAEAAEQAAQAIERGTT